MSASRHRRASGRGRAHRRLTASARWVNGKADLRFHDMRHTYASAAISAGVDAYYLSRQLGHDDPAFTQRTYVDLFEAREKAQTSRTCSRPAGTAG